MNLFPVYPLFDVEPVKGQGAWLWDGQGEKYLDFYGGHAVISIGHGHPHYVKVLTMQLKEIGFYSNSISIPVQKQAARLLGKLSGYEDWNLFFCNSGAEANENAFKIASAHNGRKKILAFTHGFHGRTSLAVSATDNPNVLFPVNEGASVVRFHLSDVEGVVREIEGGDVCCVIVEGIQGVGGIHMPSEELLKAVRASCDATDTVLILDEIQSGFGRSGTFFAHQQLGIVPDLISVAKGMGNGFPVGGVLIHPRFEARFGMLGTTFGGNHLAASATLAVLEVLQQEKLVHNARIIGGWLTHELHKFSSIKEIRGKGLMIGLEFDHPVKEIRQDLLYSHHVFTGSSSNPNVLRLLPPLNIATNELEFFLNALQKVFS